MENQGTSGNKGLPKLAPLARRFTQQPTEGNCHQRLKQALRDLLKQIRAKEQRPFYSTRELASAFRVSLSTVSAVMQELQKEGLVRIVRGSQTMVEGATRSRDVRSYGVVALPVSLPMFNSIWVYQQFFTTLSGALCRAGFTPTLAFYKDGEAASPEFCERLRNDGAETAIWLWPHATLQSTINGAKDRGIRNIIVGGENYDSLFEPNYRVTRTAAFRHGLEEWRQQKIKAVTAVGRPSTMRMRHDGSLNERFEFLACDYAQELVFTDSSHAGLHHYLKQLDAYEGIIFPQAEFAQLVAWREPDFLLELMSRHRVLLPCGPIMISMAAQPSTKADLVRIDWFVAAKQMVSDLIAEATSAAKQVIQGSWQPQVAIVESFVSLGL